MRPSKAKLSAGKRRLLLRSSLLLISKSESSRDLSQGIWRGEYTSMACCLRHDRRAPPKGNVELVQGGLAGSHRLLLFDYSDTTSLCDAVEFSKADRTQVLPHLLTHSPSPIQAGINRNWRGRHVLSSIQQGTKMSYACTDRTPPCMTTTKLMANTFH